MHKGDKIKAIEAPRACAPSGCEAPRENNRIGSIAVVVDCYADMIRVKWDGEKHEESGWRQRKDFTKIQTFVVP